MPGSYSYYSHNPVGRGDVEWRRDRVTGEMRPYVWVNVGEGAVRDNSTGRVTTVPQRPGARTSDPLLVRNERGEINPMTRSDFARLASSWYYADAYNRR